MFKKIIHFSDSSPHALGNDIAVVFHVSNQQNSVPSNYSSSNDFVISYNSKNSQQPIRRPTQRFPNKNSKSHQWHNTNKTHWHNNNFKHRRTNFKRNENCRFCGKFGHYMKDCHQFLNVIKNLYDPLKSNSSQYNQVSNSSHNNNENLNGH